MFLPRYDLIWFDIQIDQRVATLKGNFFVGYNLGHSYFKLGFICLIGIAHLTENLASLKFQKRFELRPSISTDLSQYVEEELTKSDVPEHARMIVKNLFCALRTVAAHVIYRIPICGNIQYHPEREPSPVKHHKHTHHDEDDESLVDNELKRRDLEEEKHELRDAY